MESVDFEDLIEAHPIREKGEPEKNDHASRTRASRQIKHKRPKAADFMNTTEVGDYQGSGVLPTVWDFIQIAQMNSSKHNLTSDAVRTEAHDKP